MFLSSETSFASFAVASVVALAASPVVVGEVGLKKRKIGCFGSPQPPAPVPWAAAIFGLWPVFAKGGSLLYLSLRIW